MLSYAIASLQLCTAVLWKFNAYWNSVYRKIFSYKPRESVRDVMKCLGKKNLEFIYYERKLFLYNMLFSDNDVVTCIMSVYVHSKEYAELCKHCELSALDSVTYIKRSLKNFVAPSGEWRISYCLVCVYYYVTRLTVCFVRIFFAMATRDSCPL